MAKLITEIEWTEPPLLPVVNDPAWEAEVLSRGGRPNNVDLRMAPLPWLREFCFSARTYFYNVAEMPEQLFPMVSMVVAQENSCRYCYGINRSILKIVGYSEAFIDALEREVRVAELAERESAVLAFCRRLARSRPRPLRAEAEHLMSLGYSPLAVAEIVACVASSSFYNRVITMTACPPQEDLEQASRSPLDILKQIATAFMQGIAARRQVTRQVPPLPAVALLGGPFGSTLATLGGLPAAAGIKSAVDGLWVSAVLSRVAKGLVFAVVARALGCTHSEAEARRLLHREGLDDAAVDSALATLKSEHLPASQSELLIWARKTVKYDTPVMQQDTRALAAQLGQDAVLEAVGTAALANALVRLAMLLEH
jgi:alkylhydroperoxidase family enzyme